MVGTVLEDGIEDVSAKGLRSQQVEARASVLATIIASTTIRVVAVASLLPLRTTANGDVHDTLYARRHARGEVREKASHGYHPHRGRCYDSGEDRSLSPDLLGPQALGRHILNAVFPPFTDSQPIFRNTLGK